MVGQYAASSGSMAGCTSFSAMGSAMVLLEDVVIFAGLLHFRVFTAEPDSPVPVVCAVESNHVTNLRGYVNFETSRYCPCCLGVSIVKDDAQKKSANEMKTNSSI